MRKIIYVLFVCLFIPAIGYGQGKITRHTHQSQTNNSKKIPRNVTISEPDGYINGHGYVDLGLPNGTKWAICNVGAFKPEDYGDYVAWGEATTKTKYEKNNSITFGRNVSELKTSGIIDDSNSLITTHDFATTMWGSCWRIPTNDEIKELIDSCSWKWINQGGFIGYKVTGQNGHSIFLPAAQYRGGSFFENIDGLYWCSTANDDNSSSYCIYFEGNGPRIGQCGRSVGGSIRPVSK